MKLKCMFEETLNKDICMNTYIRRYLHMYTCIVYNLSVQTLYNPAVLVKDLRFMIMTKLQQTCNNTFQDSQEDANYPVLATLKDIS